MLIKESFSFMLSFILIIRLIKLSLNECDRETPILFNNETCKSMSCTNSQFSLKQCIVNNSIIRNQWLNNIITVGKTNSTYINFAQYSNGDLVILSEDDIGTDNRYFFGIKNNGRPFFTDLNGNETLYYYTKTQSCDSTDTDREVSVVTINSTKEEYIINLQKKQNYIELFDFKNNIAYKKKTSDLFGHEISDSRGSLINLKQKNNENYFLICSLINNEEHEESELNKNLFIAQKLMFYRKESIEKDDDCLKKYSNSLAAIGNMVSCFETSLSNLICFYSAFKEVYSSWNLKYYFIILFDKDLISDNNNTEEIVANGTNDNIFFKCLHYLDEVGAFIYYKMNDTLNELVPTIIFKKLIDGHFVDYFENISEIEINSYIFNSDSMLNDFIKLSENNFIFSATNKLKDKLFIVMISIYQNNGYSIKMRTYKINTEELFSYQFFKTIKIYSYKDILILGSSYSKKDNYYNDNLHYTSLIFFGYPNSTDVNNLIINELIDSNLVTLDLFKKVRIENNLFGYTYSRIIISQFIGECDYFIFSSYKNSSISPVYNLDKNETIYGILGNIFITKFNCSIEYSLEMQTPEYEFFEKFPVKIDIYNEDDKPIFNELRQKYQGRISYYNLNLTENLRPDCLDKNCGLCLEDKKACIICKYNFYKEDNNGTINKICLEKGIDKNGKKICTNEEILNNTCNGGIITNKQFNKLYLEILKKFMNNETSVQNTIILTENVVFQIARLDDQKTSNNNGISNIDLGDCEQKLKQNYSIKDEESLIIYKQDIKTDNLATTYVLYRIFHPYTLRELNLSICSKDQITLSVPVNLHEETLSLYNRLNESGYNLFDSNDSFYNDICTPYTTENGTDIILIDRKEIIIDIGNDMNLCQSGCNLKSYDLNKNKATCICYVQINGDTFVNFDELESESFIDDLVDTLKYSNYLVMKCYKLIFQSRFIKKNVGFIFMSIIFTLYLVSVFMYIYKGRKKIDFFIKSLIKIKEEKDDNNSNIKQPNKLKKSTKSVYIDIKKSEMKREKKKEINHTEYGKIRRYKKHRKDESAFEKYLKTELIKNSSLVLHTKVNAPPIKKVKIKNKDSLANKKKKNLNSSLKTISKGEGELLSNDTKNKFNSLNNDIIPKNHSRSNKKLPTHKTNKIKIEFSKINNKKTKPKKSDRNYRDFYEKNFENLNFQELNSLDYEDAIKIDKRTYKEYYCQILRRRHLIMFTFFPINDYNLICFKFILFLISISLYMIVNAFFFSSNRLHQIYKTNGRYNLILQIPQFIYSTLISTVINLILRQLSLSESNILSIKKEDNLMRCYKKAKKIRFFLRIKFIFFICLTFLLIIFFWYYLSCFCAIYSNTQIILIKDVIGSICITMVYPFGAYLIPGYFRINALRAENHDKEGMYKFSRVLSLL